MTDNVEDPLQIAQVEARAALSRLTEKQTEVLVLGARGFTIEEVSHRLAKHRRTIEDHIVAARGHLSVETNREAIERFIILRTICGEPTRGFQRVDLSTEDIEKLFQALSFDSAAKLLTSDDFREFMRDYRAEGPKAWRARYGRWWIVGLIAIVALVLIALQLGGLVLVSALDGYFASKPS